MAVIEIAKIQVRRGQENVTGVPQLDPGEFGWAQDTQHLYIGKRISEGANNDENSRILTELDLKSILNLIGGGLSGSVASTSTYRYRDDLSFEYFRSTTTTIAKKLDIFANLTDFDPVILNGDDVTSVLQTALNDIYANSYYGTDTIRTLKLPAGQFYISDVVDLPPYVTLIGEGAGITTLVLNSAGTGMFRTVDQLGAHYEEGMQFDGRASKNVSLSNMTLAYSGNFINNYPLVSLDNSENPKITNVEFTSINTSSIFNVLTGYVSSGLGLRVQGDIGDDESTVICRDIEISSCNFNHLNQAIEEIGEVSKTVIEKNIFYHISNGISLVNTATTIPSDVLVSKNKFSFVSNEAIKTTTSSYSSRVVSSENQYYYVGNHYTGPDSITEERSPIMSFNSPGNVSSNDYFHRAHVPYTNDFYYNPLVSGNAKIINNRTYKDTIGIGATDQIVLRLPLTGQDQLVVIEYQLSNSEMSRKGRLTFNVSYDGYASVSDYYNFSETTEDESSKLIFSTDDNGNNIVSLTCSNFSSHLTDLEYTVDITV